MYVSVFRSSEADHTPGLSTDAPRKPEDMGLAADVPSVEVAAEAGGPLIVIRHGARGGLSMGLGHTIMVAKTREG